METKARSFNCTQIPSSGLQEEFECPSCNMKLEAKEVAPHCEIEIDRLRQMQADAEASKTALEEAAAERKKPYSIFQRVQRNRQTRLKQRTRKRATPPVAPAETTCPICNQNFPPSEIQRHAERCLRKSDRLSNGAEDSSNDEDGNDGCGEEYEEYEWAGQKRVRVSSFLGYGRGRGYASIGIGQSVSNHNGEDDDDEDLNVDEDDTQIYGPTQYDEADVIPTKITGNSNATDSGTQEEDVTSYMRSLITGGTKSNNQVAQTPEISKAAAATNPLKESALNCQPSSSSAVLPGTSTSTSPQQIIDSLKTKLRHYENHMPSKYKCLICLDDYRKPAISVACWHVHCEECWLRSLGTRKLCPQCNLITSPKDLRRIYL